MVAALLDVAGSLSAVFALLILVYVTTKPAINRWAAIRFFGFHCDLDSEDFLSSERTFRLVQFLMTRQQRNRRLTALYQLHQVKNLAEKDLLTAECDPLIVEAVMSHRRRKTGRENRRRRRTHRGIRCSAGCGTKFGKRRHDHNFYGGGGIQGGWFCPSNVSCDRGPKGDHYCGMCLSELPASGSL